MSPLIRKRTSFSVRFEFALFELRAWSAPGRKKKEEDGKKSDPRKNHSLFLIFQMQPLSDSDGKRKTARPARFLQTLTNQ